MNTSKNKLQERSSSENAYFADILEENKVIHWVTQNIKLLLGLLALLFLSVFLFFKFTGKSSSSIETDYLTAETEFANLNESTDPTVQAQSLNKLTDILKRRVELQSKYDGGIAQVLLNRGEFTEATPFANRSLKRTAKDGLPLYGDYARTSFVIAAKNYKEALTQSLELKGKMESTSDVKTFNDSLYLYNLLRIASLQQQLGLKTEELKTWNDFKNAALKGNNAYVVQPQVFEQVIRQLKEGKVTIFNYMEAREKALKT